ncbi:hypothetical protein [Marinobacterium jannaschii]|uniref:hypothetical protein n=1 Tax=Marinobacterium jannaschii TaxID=64970 RepID=UPI000A9DEFAD|nr:hypothetical protein [Marinobacterium jannaschii]
MKWCALTVMVVVVTLAGCSDRDDSLTLSADRLGPLQLSEQTRISGPSLQALFPALQVHYQRAEGDSLAYHYYQLINQQGEVLFSLTSFIESAADIQAEAVDIDLLQIHSAEIPDQYGIRVGEGIRSLVAKRDSKFRYGAAHHHNFIGGGKIWYSLSTQQLAATVDINPEQVSLEQALEADLKVTAISWPEAGW